MRTALTLMLLGAGLALQLVHAAQPTFDAAKAFGARPSVTSITLSPDGTKIEVHGWSNSSLRKESVGGGPNMHAGSPIEHVDRITAPVLLFHGELDREVSVEESKRLAARLTAAGKPCKLVTWQDLDDDLGDSSARAEMLRTSDEFIRTALGEH